MIVTLTVKRSNLYGGYNFQCDHGEMTEDGGHPPWFDRRDKDFVTLQKIILEPILLESFKYYVKFRYVQLVIKMHNWQKFITV